MFDSALLLNFVHFVISGLVGLVAYFFRKAQQRQDLYIEKTEQKIDRILEKIHGAHGQLMAIEEWRKLNSDRVEKIHADAHDLRERLEELLMKVMEFRCQGRER